MEGNDLALPYTHPRSVYFEITNKCNMKCVYCYAPTDMNEMSVEQIRGVLLPQIDEAKIGSICIIGGEPLIRFDDLVDLGPDFCSLQSLTELIIATNGYLLTEEKYEKLAKSFEDKLLYFAISLDSLDENIVRRNRPTKPDVFERTMAAIKLLKRKKSIFTIETVVTKDTLDDVEKTIEYVKSLGNRVAMELYPYYPTREDTIREDLVLNADEMRRLDRIRLKYLGRPLLPFDNMPCPYDPVLFEKVTPLMERYAAIERGCTAGNRSFCVGASGDVFPCNYLRKRVGNIFETTIMKIYETNPFILKLRNREVGGKCGDCTHRIECGGCRTRAFIETGDYLGGVESCETVDGVHVHASMANKMLSKAITFYHREIKLYEMYSRVKKFIRQKRR